MPAGRPREYTPGVIEDIKEQMDEYIAQTPVPIFAEFCDKYGYLRTYLYEIKELSDSIKKMMQKKEVALEKGALTGKLNTAMAIFSLKQMGWSDKQEVKHDGGISINIIK